MTKFAVCVGNNYPGTNAELSGCVNDAYDWARCLEDAGYHVIVAREANYQSVQAALTNTVNKMGWGDRLVFTYSGHGSWVPDLSGDESDKRDECLVMADMSLMLDDDLQRIFGKLPFGAGGLILSDSCHSGTVSRLVGAPTMGKARFLSPAEFTDMTREEAIEREALPLSNPRATASLISGCSDLEYSYDAWFGGRANGAFSRAALNTYESGISLSKWYAKIRTVLPGQYPQTPQVTYASLYRRYAKAL